MVCSLRGSSVHGDSPGKNIGVGCHALLQGIFPTQGSNPGLSHCRRVLYYLTPGKPKNTGVGSLSLLQGIFPTQGLNPGLPHCRWILYCLGHHLNTVKSGWSGLERQLYKDPQAPVQAWGTQQGFIIIK